MQGLDLRNDMERPARWLVIVVSLPQVEQAARQGAGGFFQVVKTGPVPKADLPFQRL